MNRRRTRSGLAVATGAAAALLIAGCSGGPAPAGGATTAASTVSAATPAPSAQAAPTPPSAPVAMPQCAPVTVPKFDAANFGNPTTITNTWMPLVPGTQFTLEGRANTGGKPLPHKIVLTVTDLVKEINGVPALVAWDVDTDKDVLAESELTFFAQDNDGNVWTMGEYPEIYQNGKLTGAPDTWMAGVANAQAGVQIRRAAKIGDIEYLQGISPGIQFLDCAKDVQLGARTCVPTGCYDGVLIVDERSPLSPDSGVQRKYYAPGVGSVQVEAVGDPDGETLVLTKVTPPNPDLLAAARTGAMELDKRGLAQSAVYKSTQPVHPGPAGR